MFSATLQKDQEGRVNRVEGNVKRSERKREKSDLKFQFVRDVVSLEMKLHTSPLYKPSGLSLLIHENGLHVTYTTLAIT